MATQGQRRREAVAAVRTLRQKYRTADSAGERVERELDRLIKRKTLIGPDQILKLGELLYQYLQIVNLVQKAYAILVQIIRNLPR